MHPCEDRDRETDSVQSAGFRWIIRLMLTSYKPGSKMTKLVKTLLNLLLGNIHSSVQSKVCQQEVSVALHAST